MTLPYSEATSGKKAVDEIEKILRNFGADNFGYHSSFATGELVVNFVYRDTPIKVKASAKGYAAAWLREKPFNKNYRYSQAEHEKRALERGQIACYSILRDWLKGQITAVETGILTFEGAFLGQILLPDQGRTLLDLYQEKKTLSITKK